MGYIILVSLFCYGREQLQIWGVFLQQPVVGHMMFNYCL